jgi:hypothetical protein
VKATFGRLDQPVPGSLIAVARTIDDAQVHEEIASALDPPVAKSDAADTPSSRPDPPAVVVYDLPTGFLEPHLRSSGCRIPGGVIFGHVEHDGTGRPKAISLPPGVSSECRRAMATVLRQSRSIGAGARLVVLPLKAAPRLGERLPQTPRVQAGEKSDTHLKSPTVRKRVRPEYPQRALTKRVEGKGGDPIRPHGTASPCPCASWSRWSSR